LILVGYIAILLSSRYCSLTRWYLTLQDTTGDKRKHNELEKDSPAGKENEQAVNKRHRLGQFSVNIDVRWGDETKAEKYTMKNEWAPYKDLEGMFNRSRDEVLARWVRCSTIDSPIPIHELNG
jgi:hypothetical protein